MRIEGVFLGRVQGVGFRATAHEVALRHGVKGWVRNEPEGTVALVGEGPDDAVEAFLKELRGRMGDRITREKMTTSSEHRGYEGFEIRY